MRKLFTCVVLVCLLAIVGKGVYAQGCTLALSAVVTDETCPGFYDGSIDLTATGASGAVTYVWSTGDVTEDIGSVTSGTYYVTATDASVCIAIDTFVVTDAHGITVSLGNDTALCEIVNYLLTPATFGATFYYWQNGAQTPTFLANGAGSYNVYVQNSFGCFAADTLELRQLPEIDASLVTTQPGCGGPTGSLNLTVTGGTMPFTYLWSNGDTIEDLNGLTAGTYSVVITDTNTCTAITNGILFAPFPFSNFSANSSLVCGDDTVKFRAFEYGFLVDGINDYFEVPDTVVVHPGNSFTLEAWVMPNSGSGAQQVIVEKRILSSNGVSIVYDPTTRKIYARQQNGPYFVQLNSDTTLQLGVWSHVALVSDGVRSNLYINGVLDQSLSYTRGTAPVNGTPWRVGGGPGRLSFNGMIDEVRFWSIALTPSQISEFMLRPIPAGFADLSLYLTFNQAPGSLLVNDRSPNGLTGYFVNSTLANVWQLSNPMDLDFFWDFGDGNVSNSQFPGHVFRDNLMMNANVTLSVTTAGGCTSRDTLVLPVHTPAIPFVLQSSDGPFCIGDTVVLYVNGSYYSYLWSTGSFNDSIRVTNSGTFEIQANDGTGCLHTDSITVNFSPNSVPMPMIVPADTTTICEGDTVLLDVGSGYAAYAWSTGGATQSIVVTQSGTYSVTVSNGIGCSRASDPATVMVLPTPTPVITNNGNALVSSTGTSYQWYVNGTPILGAIGNTYIPTGSGTYTVLVGNANGCDAMSAPFAILVGIEDADFAGELALFPNPTSQDAQISFYSLRNASVQVSILDVHGKELWSRQARILSGDNLLDLPTEKLPSGIYMVRLQGREQGLVRMLSKL